MTELSTSGVVPINYLIRLGPHLWGRASLNDLPFYKDMFVDFVGAVWCANHLLVPGVNTLRMEVAHAPTDGLLKGPFEIRIYRHDDPTIPKEQLPDGSDVPDHIYCDMRWPDVYELVPEERRSLPFRFERTFTVDGEVLPPVYANSPKVAVPLEGTPELHAAVQAFHAAFERKDAEGLIDILSLKTAEMNRHYPNDPSFTTAATLDSLRGRFSGDWDVRPLEPAELVFETRAEGRVVYVTHRRALRVIEARHETDPEQTFGTDLFFTIHEGKWRLFR